MHKKKIFFYFTFIISTILLVFLSILVLKDIIFKSSENLANKSIYEFLENNHKDVFTIENITLFSSANATSNINSNSSFNISNLTQYTDIAIFINNNSEGETYTLENTLKSVKISEINFNTIPTIGTPKLYYKNINNFSKPEFEANQEITNSLEFNISSEDTIDFNTPTLFNNCANPITFSYVNSNIRENYTLSENISNISYDGSLLKKCNITLNSISCCLNFVITIVNNLDETFTCPISIQVPLSTEKNTIYEGSLIVKPNVYYRFIKNL